MQALHHFAGRALRVVLPRTPPANNPSINDLESPILRLVSRETATQSAIVRRLPRLAGGGQSRQADAIVLIETATPVLMPMNDAPISLVEPIPQPKRPISTGSIDQARYVCSPDSATSTGPHAPRAIPGRPIRQAQSVCRRNHAAGRACRDQAGVTRPPNPSVETPFFWTPTENHVPTPATSAQSLDQRPRMRQSGPRFT